MLPGNSVMNNFLAKQADFHCNNSSIYKTKHNSMWSKEFCLVTMGGNWAVTWPPIVATRYVSFATTLNTR